MKKAGRAVIVMCTVCVFLCSSALAADRASVADKQFRAVGLLIGSIDGYFRGGHLINDTFSFGASLMTISGPNQAKGSYETVGDFILGIEKIEATCSILINILEIRTYRYTFINLSDIMLVGTVRLEAKKTIFDDGPTAGTAAGFFIAPRKIF